MRAHVDAVEVRALVFELGDERVVGGPQDVGGKVAASEARLVGDDDGGDPGGVETTDGFGRAGQQSQPGRMVHVPDLLSQRPVAVNEHGRAKTHPGSLCRR